MLRCLKKAIGSGKRRRSYGAAVSAKAIARGGLHASQDQRATPYRSSEIAACGGGRYTADEVYVLFARKSIAAECRFSDGKASLRCAAHGCNVYDKFVQGIGNGLQCKLDERRSFACTIRRRECSVIRFLTLLNHRFDWNEFERGMAALQQQRLPSAADTPVAV